MKIYNVFPFFITLILLYSCNELTTPKLNTFTNYNSINFKNEPVFETSFSSKLSSSPHLNPVASNNSNKKALIIANDNYYKATKWDRTYASNDTILLKNALIKQGFLEENIQIENDLTYTDFFLVMENFINNQIDTNDVVFFHFSGHGQQIFDKDSEEIDCLDEAIVPVDAPNFYQKSGYKGEKHIIDDELGLLFKRIQKKAGPKGNLFVTIDACHSSTASRGFSDTYYRGVSQPIVPNGFVCTNSEMKEKSGFGLNNKQEDLAPMVCFYASGASQLSEVYLMDNGTRVGALSYAFSKAFIEAKSTTTYKGLFDKIVLTMSRIATSQSPTSEGQLNQEILAGEIIGKETFFNVVDYKSFNGETFVTINGGQLHGLNKGSIIAFYDIDEGKNKVLRSLGTITNSEILISEVKLNKKLEEDLAYNAWAFMKKQSFGNLRLTVNIDSLNENLASKLKEEINKNKFIRIVKYRPDLTLKVTKNGRLQLINKNDLLFKEINSKYASSTTIVSQMREFAQSNYFRTLEVEFEDLNAEFEIIAYTDIVELNNKVISKKEVPLSTKIDENGNVIFKNGDFFSFRITNLSQKTIYYSLVDIQSNGEVKVLRLSSDSNCLDIGKGKKVVTIPFKAMEPFGLDLFKLVITDRPIDLKNIIQSRGVIIKGNKDTHPFEVFYSNSYCLNSSRGEVENLPIGSVSIISKPVFIYKE